jgi:hypothetical protein
VVTRAATHPRKPTGVAERDEILEAEVRDQLRDQGLDEDEVNEAIWVMRDQGMFDVPDWTP